ncbi:hypothetical protein F5Y16DRAFT_415726 [Xylariaceae sp. FL0255]|nr:hypothetical protein F5Y16DRAFT_415726 [Xylariaceae sp. FL0255]
MPSFRPIRTPLVERTPNTNVISVEKNTIANTKKRKSDASEGHQDDDIPEIDADDPRLSEIDMTPQQVRRKIRDFINGGNMKVGEFTKAIGVCHSTYQRFMSMNGSWKGQCTDTYPKALRFFKKRQLQGLKAKAPRRTKRTKKNNEKVDEILDVSGVSVPGENTGDVPVFETCDEVRRKVRALLRLENGAVSQAALCRTISAHCIPGEDGKVESKQMSAFLSKHGVMEGNTSNAFYGAYVFFEKKRLKGGEPKSEFREGMEKKYEKGVNVSSEDRFLLKHGDKVWRDEYGVPHFEKRGKMI